MAHSFEWIESYSVGIQAMDDDHRVLVRLVDKAINAIQDRHLAEATEQVLNELLAYAVGHFRREEALLESTRYPLLAQHRSIHDRLIRQVAEFIVDYRTRQLNTADVAEFLMDWLLTHILEADKRYTNHLHSEGVR